LSEPKYDFSKIKLIIGLGNPGAKYLRTRHSIGFRIVDKIAENSGFSWAESNLMHYSNVQLTDAEGNVKFVTLVKPMTYMNESGKILPQFQKKGIKPEEILVIHDELEKTFGNISLKFSGSHKGHNGLRSIISLIGKDFWRLKFGIGRPERREEVSDYVLRPFPVDQEAKISELIDQAISLIWNK